MSETWVVNASPLITLAKIGHLDLLRPPGVATLVPSLVASEIMAGGGTDPAMLALQSGWCSPTADCEIDQSVMEWGLGAGESAVLSLAQRPGSVAVVDDLAARTAARVLGIPFLGTLGVVLRACKQGQLESAVPLIRALKDAGLRLDDRIIRDALAGVTGEQ